MNDAHKPGVTEHKAAPLGTGPWNRATYSPRCSCGWRGKETYLFANLAKRDATKHANAPLEATPA